MPDLNPEQHNAITSLQRGSVAVVAGPGSGKTHTLVAAVRSILETDLAANLLCLTFTVKAAEQLRAKLPAQERLFIGTFHALAARLCPNLGDTYKLIDSESLQMLIRKLQRRRDWRDVSVRELGLSISRYKNGALDTDYARQLTTAYDQALREQKCIDYDDLVLEALTQARPGQYGYIFVDEFQDTSPRQYELLQALATADTRFFVIGDPRQSIYRFRGADGSVFERLQANRQLHTIHLTCNYRSTPYVVQAAGRIFPDQIKQTAVRHDRGMVRQVQTLDEYTEPTYIAHSVEQALGGTEWQHTHHEIPLLTANALHDFAVLYRTQRQGALLAQRLRDAHLPVQRLGEDSPFASPKVQLLRAMLVQLQASSAETATAVMERARAVKLRLPRQLLADLNATEPPLLLLQNLAERLGWQQDEQLLPLENIASRFDTTAALVSYIDGLAGQAFFDPTADAICLSTIHASKGLEFRHVFIAGCNQGLLPSSRASTSEDLAEEQRLFYVAVTRARDSVTLLYTLRREGQPAEPSIFLKFLALNPEIDEDMAATERRRLRHRQKRSQQSLF